MTDVELLSTVPSSQQKGWPRRAALMAGAVVTVFTSLLGAGSRPAGADPLANAKAQAARITAQLAADQQRLDAIAEQYNGAGQKVQQVNQQIAQIKSTIAQDRSQVAAAQANLRHQAVDAYMAGTPGSDLQTLFGTGGEQATVAGEYRSVASGNISGAIDSLNVAETHLATQQDQLQVAQSQAQAALTQAANARKAAQATVADQQATLAKVKGQIGALVAERQAAQQAAEHAAFLARIQPATKPSRSGATLTAAPVLPDLPAAGGAAQALAAAESQIGVPYRWGGESPGGGFDCSGLVQWAWGQAGVGLPRTTAAQYGSIAHVSLSALQPGDLVFWGPGGIDHVGIYVGGGSVIHAPNTGDHVRIQPIWNNGLVGAGRP